MPPGRKRSSVAIFAPSPILTVMIEPAGEREEVHFHAGGQGIWVARMAAGLGADVSLCVPLGGEAGTVLGALLDGHGVRVLAVRTTGANAAYVHDRRSGERRSLVETPSPVLGRHELDDFFGVAATAGLASDVTLLTGERQEGVLPADTYTRLAADLRANGRTVLADLSGQPLRAALSGGLDVVKISSEELCRDGRAEAEDTASLASAMRSLHEEGAESVLVSRAAEPALMLSEGRLLEVVGPAAARRRPARRRGRDVRRAGSMPGRRHAAPGSGLPCGRRRRRQRDPARPRQRRGGGHRAAGGRGSGP